MIQARYGWTDPQLFSLPAARFLQIIDTVTAAAAREEKQKLVAASFGSWQIIEVLKGLTNEKAKPLKFGDYLQKIGLSLYEDNKETKKEIEQQKKRALSIAAEIKALDKQQQEGGS